MIEVKYDKKKKSLAIDGALGLASVETVAVIDEGGAGLADGTLCLVRRHRAGLMAYCKRPMRD
ncbi:MAG TPA: hypothetical protein P5026_10775 [Kiritimatiellia bacterium]|nr:hypothetical protein [Kiritimatiellia bacterium]HRU71386.1 hypothetical protein [Kiritimatiellia bacterium]